MYTYVLIVSMFVHGRLYEIDKELCRDLHACNVRAIEIEYDYKSKSIYDVIIECKRKMK